MDDLRVTYQVPDDGSAQEFGRKLDLAVKLRSADSVIQITFSPTLARAVADALKAPPPVRLVEVTVEQPLGWSWRVWIALNLSCLVLSVAADPAGVVAAWLQGLLQ